MLSTLWQSANLLVVVKRKELEVGRNTNTKSDSGDALSSGASDQRAMCLCVCVFDNPRRVLQQHARARRPRSTPTTCANGTNHDKLRAQIEKNNLYSVYLLRG